jgi:peptidoglycan/xylan/chitin deacetylase (PgdA/CDA1 family)
MRAILTYHSIDPFGSPISTDMGAFRRHVRWFASGRVRVVPLDELPRLPADADAVALTFDDGFANFASLAAPLLLDHGLPVTLFVVTECVGSTNAWGGRSASNIPTLPLLDWDSLGRLAERGVTLGAHGRHHRRLATATAAEIADEVCGSAADLEARTGVRPTAFAYPYGSANAAAAMCVRDSYGWGCTTELRPLGTADRPALLPRIDAYYLRAPGRLESWGTARFTSYLRLRSLGRRVRRVVSR